MAAKLERLGLACAAVVVAVNIWTGAPLLALWIGSLCVGGTRLSMGAVVVVVVALGVLVGSLVALLTRIDAAYERLGADVVAQPVQRTTAPWLRSLRGDRHEVGFHVVERIAVVSVGVCALAFNIWFFFLSGSPLPS